MNKSPQLHADKPAIFLKSRGGLADTLQQIHKAISFAERSNRQLFIDTRGSGLKCQFDELFDLGQSGIKIATDAVQKDMDQATSVYPREVQNRVSSFETTRDEWYNFIENASQRDMAFDWRNDPDDDLIVVERAGGGSKSWKPFQKFKLNQHVAQAIISRLSVLPQRYLAVHIRHSDYKTDYRNFLRRLAPLVSGETVVICADNKGAKDLATRFLSRFCNIVELTELPQLDGQPLHETETSSGAQDAIDALTDLMTLACAHKIHFTELTKSPGQKIYFRFSGFVVLASRLSFRRGIIENSLGLEANQLASIFVGKPSTSNEGPASRAQKFCAKLGEWRWNLLAKRAIFKAWLY